MEKLKETNKLNKNEWLIAAIFFATAGAAAPLLLAEAMQRIVLTGALDNVDLPISPTMIVILLTYLSITLTVWYVAKFVKKKFEQKDSKKVALISVGYFVVIMIGWLTYEWVEMMNMFEIKGGSFGFLLGFRLVILVIYAFALYHSVKRYFR